MMDKLKPCPFCGGEAILIKASEQDSRLPLIMYDVACNNSDCLVNPNTENRELKEEAIKAWNTRHTTKIDELIEWVKGEIDFATKNKKFHLENEQYLEVYQCELDLETYNEILKKLEDLKTIRGE